MIHLSIVGLSLLLCWFCVIHYSSDGLASLNLTTVQHLRLIVIQDVCMYDVCGDC